MRVRYVRVKISILPEKKGGGAGVSFQALKPIKYPIFPKNRVKISGAGCIQNMHSTAPMAVLPFKKKKISSYKKRSRTGGTRSRTT